MTLTEGKLDVLRGRLKALHRVAIAYSGGLDSSFLLWVVAEALPGNVLAVTLVSDVQPSRDIEDACALTARLGIPHRVVEVDVCSSPGFVENSPLRCYYCKREDFAMVQRVAAEEGFAVICDGSTQDDTTDYRPGMKAAKELGVISPLLEAGFSKQEVRDCAKKLGVPQWNKPASPCLASRIPYGTEITPALLCQVQDAEAILHRLGVDEVRVRHHGVIARIEVRPSQFSTVLAHSEEIVRELKKLGFVYIVLDVEGFRSGSLNEVLPR